MTRKGKEKSVPAVRRKPGMRELAAIEKARRSWDARPVRPAVEMSIEGMTVAAIHAAHSDETGLSTQISDTFGTCSPAYANACLKHLLNSVRARGRTVTSEDLNAALAFVGSIEPKDEMEAALAVQMYAAHDLALNMLMNAKHAETWPAMQEYGNLATKLQRTFTAQIEALSKLRRGGEQVVRHIHVDNRGGQAVIAETVNTRGAGNGNVFDQPHEAGGTDAGSASMLGYDPQGNGVPVASDTRSETVPVARRLKPRRAKG